MPEVIDLLRREHADMERLLDLLERQVEVFREGGIPDYALVQEILDYCLDYPDQCHHPKEDLIYERLRARDSRRAEAVGNLQAEHAALAALTRRLADTVDQVVQDANMPRDHFTEMAEAFIKTYRRHIETEEREVFPAAEAALSAEDWTEIAARLADHENPLLAESEERRFATLRNSILERSPDAPGT